MICEANRSCRRASNSTRIHLPASGQVKRKDHNYRTPETTLLSQASTTSKIPAKSTDYVYGERAVTLEEAEQLARRRQQMYDCQRETK